jgi:hypothetical protein
MASIDAARRHDGGVLAARFADAAHARTAIEALQSAGIDGDDILLLSPFPEETSSSTRAADRRTTRYLLGRVVRGVLVGMAGGTILGVVIGVPLVGATAPAQPLGQIAALAAVGMVIGVSLGAYVGFERAGTLSDAWSTTFHELEPGATWIGVRMHDRSDQRRARRALDRVHPREVRKL